MSLRIVASHGVGDTLNTFEDLYEMVTRPHRKHSDTVRGLKAVRVKTAPPTTPQNLEPLAQNLDA